MYFLSFQFKQASWVLKKIMPHLDSSFEHPQHMFWLKNKKINFQFHTLIGGATVV